MYFVYILKSKIDNSFYTGITKNVQKRLQDHNEHSSQYSSSKAPFELIWYCSFQTKTSALNFEKYLKTGSGIAFRNKHFV